MLPASKPPITFPAAIIAKINPVRPATFSKVANAGTAISKAPQPKPIKIPSTIINCMAGVRQTARSPASFFSGTQLRSCGVNERESPPIIINPEQSLSAISGDEFKEMLVAKSGPKTPTEFITAVSIAYAVRT